jgi:hypothetical protein
VSVCVVACGCFTRGEGAVRLWMLGVTPRSLGIGTATAVRTHSRNPEKKGKVNEDKQAAGRQVASNLDLKQATHEYDTPTRNVFPLRRRPEASVRQFDVTLCLYFDFLNTASDVSQYRLVHLCARRGFCEHLRRRWRLRHHLFFRHRTGDDSPPRTSTHIGRVKSASSVPNDTQWVRTQRDQGKREHQEM